MGVVLHLHLVFVCVRLAVLGAEGGRGDGIGSVGRYLCEEFKACEKWLRRNMSRSIECISRGWST